MSHAADILAIDGIQRPEDVVTIAAAAGLGLAHAATLLQQESDGGHNVWGHDGVPTAGAYVKGGPVTEANYAAYRLALAAGTAGRQGCGPTQLTAADFQDRADRLGGCWRWEVNARVGFETLAGYLRRFGPRDAFVAYNGGTGAIHNPKSPAQAYGDRAVKRLAWWSARLAGTTTGPIPTVEDDMPYTPEDLTRIVRDAVWGTLLPDHYRAEGDTADRAPFPAGEVLAWACTHAAKARDNADDARAWVQHIAQTAAAAAPAIDYTALAAALLDGLAERRAAA